MSPNDTTLLGAGGSVAVDYDPFAGSALARVAPSSAPQRELWLASTLEPEASLAYNESVSLRLQGPLDVAALQAALNQLMERHEALRATFSADGQELYIAAEQALPCAVRDLSWLGVDEREADIEETLRQAVTTPFHLETGPLVRAELLNLDPDDHLLVITAHHIVCDGWSFGVLVRDLAALYARQLGGDAELPLAEGYCDYALAEAARGQGAEGSEDETYWLRRFADATPSLDLPTDHPRPRQRSFASRREDLTLDAALVAGIKRLGAQHGASFYATLLTAYGLLLQRLSGQDDVVVGIPCAGQASGGHDALVGHCVNVLPLRMSMDIAAPFSDAIKQVRGDLLDAFDHQQYTLGSLLARLSLARDPARLPLVSVLFNLDQALDERVVSFPGLSFVFSGNPRAFENFELFVNAVQLPDGLRLECQYNSALFDGATIRAWLEAYETLLREAIASPQAAAGALGLVSATALTELRALQPPATPYPETRLAHEYFEAQVDRAPERAAVSDGTRQLSYAELEARANQLAHVLRQRGVKQGDLVGLSLKRTTDMTAAVLAVLKSGAGYVPLDPCFPADRLAFMAEDAALAALVVDDNVPAAFAFPDDRVVSLARDADAIASASTARAPRDEHAATPDTVAYVIFTSGSTGRPKGVRVPHRTTSNFLTSMQRVPGIGSDDRLVAVTTLSFDIAFMEMMLPLCVGAEIVIAGHDDVRDGAALRSLVERSGATMMQATPAGWRILIESGWQGRPDFRAVSGGEPLQVDLAEALLARCGEVWNGYGPTETTVYSTYWRVERPRDGITIGTPVANTTVHILDERGALCPLGMPGEITIGGAGVTLGYLNRPDLTADRFIADPFAATSGARMYRTGDRGRWRANGQIEHMGRLDFQVKVRGYRIELGEIETVLADAPGVARAVVMAREDRPGDVRLVAYVVAQPQHTLDEDALRDAMKRRLPDYMLPQHLVVLDTLPLLPNGKINRKALPAPALPNEGRTERTAPRNDTERRVAEAMETVLALPELDIHDDFFAMGGHSLLAAQLTARLNREFNITLSFRTLFDAPTIERLAAAIDALLASGKATAAPPIVRREQQDRAPLSLMQHRLWALEELQPGRVTYNAPSAHRLRGRLDEAAFERALQALTQRQPILRTAFRHDGDDVMQIVAERVDTTLFPAEDLSHLPADARDATLMTRLQTLTDTPFDLGTAPLFSARMFRLGEEDHVFFFMPHHIIWDGWSFDIMYTELSQLYRAFAAGEASPLPPLPVSYGDFATWHAQWLESEPFQDQVAYWREKLAKVAETHALPTDHPRRPGMSGIGRTEWIRVSRELTDAMHEVARQADATLNMTLLALYYVMLSGMNAQRHLVVGTPVRARNQTEVESVMGYFNNLLPLHMSVDPSARFIDFVKQVKDAAIDSFGHPDVPLEYLQRELRSGHGNGAVLYQALFSFQDARQRVVDWGGLSHEQVLLFQSGATEDLGLWFLENNKGMLGGITYNADILQAHTARLQRERYLALLSRVCADPTQTIHALNAPGADELAQMQPWNTTATGDTQDVVTRFETLAASMPSNAAYGNTSYGELEARANRIASCLHRRGVDTGTVVGLMAPAGLDHAASLLAILKCHATAVLLDPAESATRLDDLIRDAGITLLLGNSAIESELGWPRAKALWLDADAREIMAASDQGIDAHAPALEQAAWVVYAPGPDGKPCGHAVSRLALARMADGLRDQLMLTPADRVVETRDADAAGASLQLLTALSTGASFVHVPVHGPDDVGAFGTVLQAQGASVAFASPLTWQQLLDTNWQGHATLKAICVQQLPMPELAAALAQRCESVWCVFGSDDGALVTTFGRLEQPAEGAHAGQPLPGTGAWVLDAQGRACAAGAIGEIHVAGDTLSAPFGRRAAAHASADRAATPDLPSMRPTGFHGRWLAHGELQPLGRRDRRVAIEGHPVDPASVEAILLAQPGVAQALAVLRSDAQGALWLNAYVVPARGASPDRDAMARTLGEQLGRHEVPRHVIWLDALPLTARGAVDIAALPQPSVHGDDAANDAVQPKSPGERLLAALWCELLHISAVRTSDNFFDVGGHSLLAVEMAARVQARTGVRLNLLDIANGTLGTLAAELPQSAHGELPPDADATRPALGQRLRKLFGRH